MAAKSRIGYIGLGLMGKPMARNILMGGYPLVVHNRSRGAVDELMRYGAEGAFSPAEVASRVDVVFTNLPDSPDVEQVALGEGGLIEGAHRGLVYVDNSTIKPAIARLIADRMSEVGVSFLDAPVSGGKIGAEQGVLTIMVGGQASVLDQVRPILEVLGKKITHVGDVGSGQIAKAANQIMVAAQMVAMAELMIFSKKAGADPQKVIQAIQDGAAQCWTLDNKPKRLFDGVREPEFKAYMQAKDLAIVMDSAKEYTIPLNSAGIHTQLFNSMLALGMGELDNSAVIGVIELLADCKLID